MKKFNRRIVPLVLVLVMILALTACGKAKTPYLSEKERNNIQNLLLDAIEICQESPEFPNSWRLYFQNPTKYDLTDVRVIFPNTTLRFPLLRASEKVKMDIYTGDMEMIKGERISLYVKYTIGEYVYVTENEEKQIEENALDHDLQISVETKNGEKSLPAGTKVSFEDGEIKGLSTAKITSATVRVGQFYGGGYFVTIDFKGKAPADRIDLGAKLYNEDGAVVGSDSIYIGDDGQGDFYTNYIKPGRYILRFVEQAW